MSLLANVEGAAGALANLGPACTPYVREGGTGVVECIGTMDGQAAILPALVVVATVAVVLIIIHRVTEARRVWVREAGRIDRRRRGGDDARARPADGER